MSMTLADLADKMRGIDIAMLSTKTVEGQIASRPMSNNRDVAYDGTSYYFARDTSGLIKDIEQDANVALAFAVNPGLLSSGLYIAVEGMALVIRDKSQFRAHWNSDLDAWFEQGVETPGVVMIKVGAERIAYWQGEDQGHITL